MLKAGFNYCPCHDALIRDHVYLVRCHLSLNTCISTQSYRNMGQLGLQKLLTRLVRKQVVPAGVWFSNGTPPNPTSSCCHSMKDQQGYFRTICISPHTMSCTFYEAKREPLT